MANGAPESPPEEVQKPKALKGTLPIYRRDLLLLREKKLPNLSAFGAWIIFLLAADWDEKHPRFGCVPSAADIARFLRVAPSTIQRHRQTFMRLGLLRKREDGKCEIVRFWKYRRARELARLPFANLHEENAYLQRIDAYLHGGHAAPHESPRIPNSYVSQGSDFAWRNPDALHANLHEGHSSKETLKNPKESLEKPSSATPQPRSLALARRDSSPLDETGATPCDSCRRTIVPPFIREITSRQCGRSLCTGCYVGSKTRSGTPAQDSKP